MYDVSPYAYSLSGNLFVLADGPELLVYSAANDQGLWKLVAEDILVGVGVTEEQVFAADAGGRITAYRPVDGQQLYRLDTDSAPIAMRTSADGHCILLEADGICIVRPSADPIRVAWSSPRQAAWDPESARVGVGGEDGTFAVVDPGSGGAWGTQSLGSAITGVCWRSDGSWAVAHGQQISFVSADGTEILTTLPLGAPSGEVSISGDGALMAVGVGPQAVRVYELHANRPVGDVVFERDLGHLQFGPKHWLGFGFDDGDANRVDLASGKLTRTQAHVGRGQNAWTIKPTVNQALVRGGIANVASAGAAIATKGVLKVDKPVKKTKSRWPLILGLGGIGLLAIFFFCCGGAGLVAMLPTGVFN